MALAGDSSPHAFGSGVHASSWIMSGIANKADPNLGKLMAAPGLG